MPELYKDDLHLLTDLLEYVDQIANHANVCEIEIRARIFEGEDWAVLGYGEAGDPCVLRFERDTPPYTPPIKLAPGVIPYTINEVKKQTLPLRCQCGDWAMESSNKCGPNGCYNCPA